MRNPRIEIVAAAQPHEIEFVNQQILNFNRDRTGDDNYEPVTIFLRNTDDQIVGGLIGSFYWQWLYVELLWVHESLRGEGYGARLLATAEQEAVKRGCRYAHLDTFSFQAPEFYQKRGYVIFGELLDFPAGHKRFFLKKDLQKRPQSLC